MTTLVSIVFILVGLVGLYFGGEMLVKGASRLAGSLGISPLVIGLTVVAFGTSAPELLVNAIAALEGAAEMAVGNVIGSNVANIGLILGVTGIIAPIAVQSEVVRRHVPFMIVATGVVGLTVINGYIGRIEGILLILAFISYTIYTYRLANRQEAAAEPVERQAPRVHVKRSRELLRFVAGIILLAIGAQLLVGGATEIATVLGISQTVIGITVVAFGTSLPELTASVVSARYGETELALGNVVGSNIANLLLVLGVTSTIQPISIDPATLRFGFFGMFLFALFLFPLSRDRVLARIEALFLLFAYVAFIAGELLLF